MVNPIPKNLTEIPKTRAEARERGEAYYFTGQFCKNGHMSLRTVYWGCCGCKMVKDSQANHSGKRKPPRRKGSGESPEQRRKRYEQSKEWSALLSKRWRKANKARKAESDKRWKQENYERVKIKARRNAAKRYIVKKRSQIDKSNCEQVKRIYLWASLASVSSGVPHEVDHIVPLCGKNVSGLHVAHNLQILPWWENREKGNSYTFDGCNG